MLAKIKLQTKVYTCNIPSAFHAKICDISEWDTDHVQKVENGTLYNSEFTVPACLAKFYPELAETKLETRNLNWR
jgi:hypothetical protein